MSAFRWDEFSKHHIIEAESHSHITIWVVIHLAAAVVGALLHIADAIKYTKEQ